VEVIPKAQINPINQARLSLTGFNAYYKFNPSLSNLGGSGSRSIAIFVKSGIYQTV